MAATPAVRPNAPVFHRLLITYVVGLVAAWAYIEIAWWWWRAKWRFRAVMLGDLRRWMWMPPKSPFLRR